MIDKYNTIFIFAYIGKIIINIYILFFKLIYTQYFLLNQYKIIYTIKKGITNILYIYWNFLQEICLL